MGLLANHVPSIEQLKPGLIEVIEENAGSKQFFRASPPFTPDFAFDYIQRPRWQLQLRWPRPMITSGDGKRQ